jgi:4-amino-4-deoxy-L-arabinose transferase-like glycosyltransferase
MSERQNRYSGMSTIFEIIFFCILGLIPRLLLLFHNQAGIESDEAIVGLMGKHILEGRGIPVFYYGQAYMGSLEAIFAAISFFFFGVNNWALKLVPLFFSILLIAITYQIGLMLSGRVTARIASLFLAIAPSPLIIWSLKARGGFIETLVIGSSAILITSILLLRENPDYKKDRSLWFTISAILGLGWWTNNQIIFYIAPLGVVLLIRLLMYRKFLNQLRITVGSILFFILGSLPFWIFNLREKPKWSSFEVLFGNTSGNYAGKYFEDYWSTALPIILGARQFWSDHETFPSAALTAYLLYGLSLALGFILALRISPKTSYTRKLPLLCFVLFLVFVPTIFSLSSFGWLSKAPRYLLPLYSVLPLLVAMSLSLPIRSRNLVLKLSGYGMVFGITLLNLSSNYLHGIADEGQPVVFKRERVAKDHFRLYDWLYTQGISHVYTNYWIGYRIAFETNEEITFTRFGTPRSLRIPEYERMNAPEEVEGKTFILVPGEAKAFKEWLGLFGLNFSTQEIGEPYQATDYIVFYNITYKSDAGIKIPLKLEQISYFIPPWGKEPPEVSKNIEGLIDGNRYTRWGTGTPQVPGMAVEIKLEEVTPVSRIVLDHTGFAHDIPSALRITGYNDMKGTSHILFSMRDTRHYKEIYEYGMLSPVWDIRFDTIFIDRLRFELMEGKLIFDWSMNDLQVFSPEDTVIEDSQPIKE